MSKKKAAPGPLLVPKLQIQGDASKKRSLREGRRNYYTHKMGAGYKSRCTDTERWQQFSSNEYRWASSGTNFSCPFHFISKEAAAEENTSSQKETELTALEKLNDNIITSSGKIRYISLEEFNVKKLNIQEYEEWESEMRQKAFSKRKNKGEHDSSLRPKLRTQRSKLFQGLPSASHTTKSSDYDHSLKDLKITKNPLYYMARDEKGVMEKLAKILEFRRMRFESMDFDYSVRHDKLRLSSGQSQGKTELLRPDDGRRKGTHGRRSLRKTVRDHLTSPRGHKSTDFGHESPYRSTDKKKNRSSVEFKNSCEPLSARLSDSTGLRILGRDRASTTTTPLISIFEVPEKPPVRNIACSLPISSGEEDLDKLILRLNPTPEQSDGDDSSS